MPLWHLYRATEHKSKVWKQVLSDQLSSSMFSPGYSAVKANVAVLFCYEASKKFCWLKHKMNFHWHSGEYIMSKFSFSGELILLRDHWALQGSVSGLVCLLPHPFYLSPSQTTSSCLWNPFCSCQTGYPTSCERQERALLQDPDKKSALQQPQAMLSAHK